MDRKTLLVGLSLFALIAAVAAGVYFFSEPASFRGTTYAEPYPVAPEIELTHADGSEFRLSEQRGKIVMVFFGYTSCPDICPTTMAELNQALGKIGDKADEVQVLYITVDPERDTPERVEEYVNHFNADFIGLSGSDSELTRVWSNYGVFRQKVEGASAAGYLVDHTARVTVIDQDGNLRVSFPFDTPVDDIVHDLKLMLKERG
ncbi:MAG TPA: SCO family protein [Anaerolineales bacterium]|nr:SCO family protein [Anaerolineales bacterium]